MEIHQLKYFVALTSSGTFSKAAERCGISQPSLSVAIQRLEAEIDEKLFIRLPHKAVLTPAGQTFLQRALRILHELETSTKELREARDLHRGVVTVGVLPTISPYFLPRVVAQFKKKWPNIQLTIVEEATSELLKLLDGGEIDLAIVSPPIPSGSYEIENLFTEELLLALPSEHPINQRKIIRVNDLENEPFIMMKEGHCLANQTMVFCGQQHVQLQIVLRSSQIETVQAMVAVGLGISFVPRMARVEGRSSLAYRSVEKPKPMRTIATVWRRRCEHTRATAEFLSQLRHAAKGC